ncbi:archaellin/type IV pilin N-terminal domain-containing protein [Halohasta salina]|uniref:archaellin/type IV pilin N-terminal domain-containing protein n=1 Tax=Halohasta salina TaxID=2961621 RepID=UPI0020A52277|nr:archaellin/type IV pilin N-terminal domain-containing protein [Halohasta salina]
MFKELYNTDSRGQVGIGTLIVFIAMVLVAAIAAGVLINTAGLLQTQAEATGQETRQQVADRLQVQSATGQIKGEQGNATLENITLIVTKSPGAGDIQLENVTFQLVTDDKVTTDVINKDNVENITSDTNDNVITDRADRYEIILENGTDYNETIEGGDSATITLTTSSGASTIEELRVPDSLVGRTAVRL